MRGSPSFKIQMGPNLQWFDMTFQLHEGAKAIGIRSEPCFECDLCLLAAKGDGLVLLGSATMLLTRGPM